MKEGEMLINDFYYYNNEKFKVAVYCIDKGNVEVVVSIDFGIDKDNYRYSCVVNKNTCINSANEIAKTIKGLIEYCIKGKIRRLIENKTMILLSGENDIGPTFILE